MRREVGKILAALAHLDFNTEYGKMVPLLIVGVTPTVLIGLVFGNLIIGVFQNVLSLAVAFVVCGIVLYASKVGEGRTGNLSYSVAMIVGAVQGIALIPGISRSGLTISVAVLLGIKREKAFQFSFLLSIPATLGALALTLYGDAGNLASASLGWIEIFAGTVISMFVGYFALKLLLKILTGKKLYVFAFYCWLLGAVLIVLGLLGF